VLNPNLSKRPARRSRQSASRPARGSRSIAPPNWIATLGDSKLQCCPNTLARKIPRDVHEDARDVARADASTPEYAQACRHRKKIEMLFAHLKRILRATRLRLKEVEIWVTGIFVRAARMLESSL
jgi:hypothetical protein